MNGDELNKNTLADRIIDEIKPRQNSGGKKNSHIRFGIREGSQKCCKQHWFRSLLLSSSQSASRSVWSCCIHGQENAPIVDCIRQKPSGNLDHNVSV